MLEWVLRDLLGRELRNCILTLQDLLEQMQEVRLFVVVVVRESFDRSYSRVAQDSRAAKQEDWAVVAVLVSSAEQEEGHSPEAEVSVASILEPV